MAEAFWKYSLAEMVTPGSLSKRISSMWNSVFSIFAVVVTDGTGPFEGTMRQVANVESRESGR